MNIFRRQIRDKYRALATLVCIYTGTDESYLGSSRARIEHLISLKAHCKKSHGMELDLIEKGKLIIIDVTITLTPNESQEC